MCQSPTNKGIHTNESILDNEATGSTSHHNSSDSDNDNDILSTPTLQENQYPHVQIENMIDIKGLMVRGNRGVNKK